MMMIYLERRVPPPRTRRGHNPQRHTDAGPAAPTGHRACVRVDARVLVPSNIYVHTTDNMGDPDPVPQRANPASSSP